MAYFQPQGSLESFRPALTATGPDRHFDRRVIGGSESRSSTAQCDQPVADRVISNSGILGTANVEIIEPFPISLVHDTPEMEHPSLEASCPARRCSAAHRGLQG